MAYLDDKSLRDILREYTVPAPRVELIFQTKSLMRQELKKPALAPSWQVSWLLMLAGVACMLTMGLFYTYTVGTIVSYLLPAALVTYVSYPLYAFAAIGGVILAGLTLIFCMKQYQTVRVALPVRY